MDARDLIKTIVALITGFLSRMGVQTKVPFRRQIPSIPKKESESVPVTLSMKKPQQCPNMSISSGLSSIRSQEQYISSAGSGALNAKMLSTSSFACLDLISSGRFMNLKVAAEKLGTEQASMKSDLEIAIYKLLIWHFLSLCIYFLVANCFVLGGWRHVYSCTHAVEAAYSCINLNSKLKKLLEQIQMLEEKLQNAFSENAKLNREQNKEETIWKGLESKFSKTRSDKLTKFLRQLTAQVQDAEKLKAFVDEKLSLASKSIDKLHEDTELMSLRRSTSEETVMTYKKELMELGLSEERTEMLSKDEQKRAATVVEQKAVTIKQLEVSVATNKIALDGLISKREELHLGIRGSKDALLDMWNFKETFEKENTDLISGKLYVGIRLEMALKKIKNLEEFVNMLILKFDELENQSLALSEKVFQLDELSGSCIKLAQQEKDIVAHCSQQKLNQMHHQCRSVTSEGNSLLLHNQELNDKEQEFAMVQHADECHLADQKIQKLECEAETLLSEQNEIQALISMLGYSAKTSLDNSRLSDGKMLDSLIKLSLLESESKGLMDGLKADTIQDQIDILQKEIEKNEDNIGASQTRVSELESAVGEKYRLLLELKPREEEFEDHKTEILKEMSDKESLLEDAMEQYNQMLECKQLESSKKLREIYQRIDQDISDIRNKYETEKQESVVFEKEKGSELHIIGPRKQRKRETPKAKNPQTCYPGCESRKNQNPSHIGALICEGSLNFCTDDPASFD